MSKIISIYSRSSREHPQNCRTTLGGVDTNGVDVCKSGQLAEVATAVPHPQISYHPFVYTAINMLIIKHPYQLIWGVFLMTAMSPTCYIFKLCMKQILINTIKFLDENSWNQNFKGVCKWNFTEGKMTCR